jgi:hypothetical protein
MSDERSGRGIEIPGDVADSAGLPDDLNAAAADAYPYAVPDPARRKKAARVYLMAALLVVVGIVAGLPAGMWFAVALLLAIAGYNVVAGWHLRIREGSALEVANRAIGFPVGHASANLGFYGWRARPIWNVLVFSADDPPTRRGLVRIDGITGDVVEQYDEAIPQGEV